jgi:tetratricopeptide (TPR) repeat protein
MGSKRAVRAQVTLAIALVVAAPRAFADAKQDAQAHVAKAAEYHQAGKYRDALGELTAAYALDPQPGLLYAIAQVHVKLDECAVAIDYYQQFLGTHPDAKPSAAAHEAIDACKTIIAKQPKPVEQKPVEQKPVEQKPVEPTPVEQKPIEPVDRKPLEPVEPVRTSGGWYTDPITDVALGLGVAGGVASVLLYRGATSDLDQAEQQTTYDAHQSLVDRAHTARTYAVVAGAAGAALVGVAVVRIVTHHDAGTHGVAIAPATGGGLVTWAGRW